MKMNNPELEVIRFGAEDVIATSTAPVALHSLSADNVFTATCDQALNTHVHLTSVPDNPIADCCGDFYSEGVSLGNGYFSRGSLRGEPVTPDDVGKWYYMTSEGYFYLCGSGQ